MEFLNIHLQLALINSSGRPLKLIVGKYPNAFNDQSSLRSLINSTIFQVIDQTEYGFSKREKKIIKFESFPHLENYFFRVLWNEVGRLYEEEKEFELKNLQLNESTDAYLLDMSLGSYESVEDLILKNDSYGKLCSAIRSLEVSELRNRATRIIKRSDLTKIIKTLENKELSEWHNTQISSIDTLNENDFNILHGLHCLLGNITELDAISIALINNIKNETLSEFELRRLKEASSKDNESSNLYGFANRLIEESNVSCALENGDAKKNRHLVSGQRLMIRRELGRFRRG